MHEHLEPWLKALASSAPAPGGGSAAGVTAAIAASLICMSCRLTIGKPKYAQHEAELKRVLDGAETLRLEALQLAREDGRAFERVIEARQMPRQSVIEQERRAEAIAQASVPAAQVPLRAAELAEELIQLAARIVGCSAQNVVSDVAAAAILARAALEASLVNVHPNLQAIEDEPRVRSYWNASSGFARRARAPSMCWRRRYRGCEKKRPANVVITSPASVHADCRVDAAFRLFG